MSNVNANVNNNMANMANNNSNRVFPSPNQTGCGVLPYDGLVHGGDAATRGDVYSNSANKNQLGDEKQYKYWRTSKVTDQVNVWGNSSDRGGVVYKKDDHGACKSLSDSDTVSQEKMNQHYDNMNNPAMNDKSFKSLNGQDIDADGNVRGMKIRDYYTYGTFTASGGFVPATDGKNMAPSGKSCKPNEMEDNYYGWMNQTRGKYNPALGSQKSCGKAEDEYRRANGSYVKEVKMNGEGVACQSVTGKYEDHNEQYMKDHYNQFKSGSGQPDQKILDNYKTNFMLLSQGQAGTTNYLSFGGNVNPFKNDDMSRSNNAHIPSYTY